MAQHIPAMDAHPGPGASYAEARAAAIAGRVRWVLSVGVFLYLGFHVLDRHVYPALAGEFLWVRAAVSAVLAAAAGLMAVPAVRRRALWVCDGAVLVAAAGICWMVYRADGAVSEYYEGLNLVLLAMFTMNSFALRHTLVVGLSVLGLYLLAAVAGGLAGRETDLITALFFLGSTLLFVALMTRLYGRQHRGEFEAAARLADNARDLERAYGRLRETEQLKDELFANVSHELRTPLTLVLAPLESLLTDTASGLDERSRRLLSVVHDNAVRLLQMVTGLLDFSRLQAGKVEPQREPTDVAATTRALVADFGAVARRKGVALSVDAPARAVVEMDRYLFERVLFNLLSNAVKFTEPGGRVEVSLALEGAGDSQQLRLSVRDTGIGIEAQDLPRLFRRFTQLEGSSTRRFEGTGLGLALVQEFAGLLGGAVSVESAPSEGSTFTVRCLAAATSAAVSADTSPRPRATLSQEVAIVAEARAAEGAPRVLVAEDNAELAAYIAALLGSHYVVRRAADGEEALAIAREWLPDFVLADVMMPRLDGLALCRALKADPATASVPVVLLTAMTDREALLRGWEAGADDYLFKPFHPKELVARVRSLLEATRARRLAEEAALAEVRARARAAAELEQLEVFARVSSHDLQEPLRKIGALADVLAEELPNLPDGPRDYLEALQRTTGQMSRMISRLREFARVAARRAPLVRVELDGLLARVVARFGGALAAAGGVVTVQPRLPAVTGDTEQLEELFGHLLRNAVEAAREGVPLRVELGACLVGAEVEIAVEDNGVGFDARGAARIFEPFARVHGPEGPGGVGMGLAIARKIVLRHGGGITASGSPGQGARFVITLPAALAEAVEA